MGRVPTVLPVRVALATGTVHLTRSLRLAARNDNGHLSSFLHGKPAAGHPGPQRGHPEQVQTKAQRRHPRRRGARYHVRLATLDP